MRNGNISDVGSFTRVRFRPPQLTLVTSSQDDPHQRAAITLLFPAIIPNADRDQNRSRGTPTDRALRNRAVLFDVNGTSRE